MALTSMILSHDKVSAAMARKGYTQKGLAEAIGVTPQRLGAILRKQSVLASSAGRIAKALDVDVTEIID